MKRDSTTRRGDDMLKEPETLLTAAGGALLTIMGWIWARLVGQQDRHELRLIELEKNMATKIDIGEVYESITQMRAQSHEQYKDIATRMGEQHGKMLDAILRGSSK